MKKLILFFAACSFIGNLAAQNSALGEARLILAANDYRRAIILLNDAVKNEETKNNAETWFLRGLAYQQQIFDSTVKSPGASTTAYISLMKALELDHAYSTEINSALYSNALVDFNEATVAYPTDPAEAYNKFMRVLNIYNSGGGKRFATNESFASVAALAKTNAAYSAISAKKYNEALPILNEIRHSSAAADSNIYRFLIDIYQQQNNHEDELAVIKEARTLFPASETFRNQEINWYINNGGADVLLTKLEEAIKKDPDNPELFFNLGNTYEKAAFPKNSAGEILPKPANFDKLFAEAELAYGHALKLSPDNTDYNYNFGVLYYTDASGLIAQMNKITGTTDAENKEYDRLKFLRDECLLRAADYFEKVYSILNVRTGNLNEADKTTYKNSLTGLYSIYSATGKKEKADETKLKLDSIR